MRVKAAPGLKVPKEGNPREYITEEPSVEIAESTYYRRRLMAGELLADPEEAVTAVPTPLQKTRKESQS